MREIHSLPTSSTESFSFVRLSVGARVGARDDVFTISNEPPIENTLFGISTPDLQAVASATPTAHWLAFQKCVFLFSTEDGTKFFKILPFRSIYLVLLTRRLELSSAETKFVCYYATFVTYVSENHEITLNIISDRWRRSCPRMASSFTDAQILYFIGIVDRCLLGYLYSAREDHNGRSSDCLRVRPLPFLCSRTSCARN